MSETRSFPYPISIPPLIFKLDFLPFFGLYSQAETTSVTTKTRTKILGGGVFLKNFCSEICMMPLRKKSLLNLKMKNLGYFDISEKYQRVDSDP